MLTAFIARTGKGSYNNPESLKQASPFVWGSWRYASTDSNRPSSMEWFLLVLDGLDDALAGGGAGREETGEDTYEEAREQGREGR
jgi:hypothetical protein